jgi:hypothetical protein
MPASSLLLLLYETLEVREERDGVSDLLPMVPSAFIKILYEEWRQSIKNLEIFFMDILYGYYCEPSQRIGNRLVLNKVWYI